MKKMMCQMEQIKRKNAVKININRKYSNYFQI